MSGLAGGRLELGFSSVELASAQTLNARYLQGRADGLRVAGEGRIALARV